MALSESGTDPIEACRADEKYVPRTRTRNPFAVGSDMSMVLGLVVARSKIDAEPCGRLEAAQKRCIYQDSSQ